MNPEAAGLARCFGTFFVHGRGGAPRAPQARCGARGGTYQLAGEPERERGRWCTMERGAVEAAQDVARGALRAIAQTYCGIRQCVGFSRLESRGHWD